MNIIKTLPINTKKLIILTLTEPTDHGCFFLVHNVIVIAMGKTQHESLGEVVLCGFCGKTANLLVDKEVHPGAGMQCYEYIFITNVTV